MLRVISSCLSPRYHWKAVVDGTGLTGLRLKKVESTVLGWKLTVRLPSHLTPAELDKSRPRLAVFFSAGRVRVMPDESDLSRPEIFIDFALAVPPLDYPSRDLPVWLPLRAGTPSPPFYSDDGSPGAISLHGSSILLAGNPGSGKSTGVRVLPSTLSQQRNTALFGIDRKAVELAPWRGRFTRLIRGHDPDEVKGLLEHLISVIHHRADYMSQEGIVTLAPSQGFPTEVLVVDEWAELASIGTKTQRQEIADLLRRFVSLGRVLVAPQFLRPSAHWRDN